MVVWREGGETEEKGKRVEDVNGELFITYRKYKFYSTAI